MKYEQTYAILEKRRISERRWQMIGSLIVAAFALAVIYFIGR